MNSVVGIPLSLSLRIELRSARRQAEETTFDTLSTCDIGRMGEQKGSESGIEVCVCLNLLER